MNSNIKFEKISLKTFKDKFLQSASTTIVSLDSNRWRYQVQIKRIPTLFRNAYFADRKGY